MTSHHHAIKTRSALALTLGAIAPTAASARFELNARLGPPARRPPPAVQIVRVSAPGGFDWSSAGIGAAGGFGLSMLALGGALTVSQRRARRHNGPTALSS